MNSIKDFWDDMAREHGGKDTATAPDSAYRSLEINRIIPYLRGPNILDVGCGNGFSTVQFLKASPENWYFTGMDYSQAMIDRANEVETDNLSYFVGDVLNMWGNRPVYDTIVSERCLINLTSWDEQMQAIRNMAECLKPDGRMIIVENFVEGLENLNRLRALFDLHPISVRWHNRYLRFDEFEPFIEDNFRIKQRTNIGNLYYIISRVVYAALAKADGKEPEYSNPINTIAASLPHLGDYHYSPNMLYVVEKK